MREQTSWHKKSGVYTRNEGIMHYFIVNMLRILSFISSLPSCVVMIQIFSRNMCVKKAFTKHENNFLDSIEQGANNWIMEIGKALY